MSKTESANLKSEWERLRDKFAEIPDQSLQAIVRSIESPWGFDWRTSDANSRRLAEALSVIAGSLLRKTPGLERILLPDFLESSLDERDSGLRWIRFLFDDRQMGSAGLVQNVPVASIVAIDEILAELHDAESRGLSGMPKTGKPKITKSHSEPSPSELDEARGIYRKNRNTQRKALISLMRIGGTKASKIMDLLRKEGVCARRKRSSNASSPEHRDE